MSQVNQKTATVQTILAVLAEDGINYELNGPTRISEVLTAGHKEQVRNALFEMFRDGSVTYKPEFQDKVDDDSELKKYISGLVNNWIRKNPEFNCGEKYKAKNPGSRAHVGDDRLKALKALSEQCAGDEAAQKQIADEIVKRKAEIAAEKAKSVEINVDALPEHLRGLVTTDSNE